MNDKRKFKLFMVFFIIASLCVLAFTGLGSEKVRIIKGVNEIRTGIDIRGGISAILEPVYPNGSEGRDIKADLETSKTIIEDRLDAQGIFDKSVNVDATNNRLIIDIPWGTNETEFNPRETLKDLGSTGALTFQEVNDEDLYTLPKDLVPTGRIVLSGEDVKTASVQQDQRGQIIVLLELKPSGVEAFSKATAENLDRPLAIFIDDRCISAPRVDSQITSSESTISGNFTYESAKSLADKIRFGALPTKLEAIKVDSISAQLGMGALEVAVKAGIVGFILVALFMISYYRIPGIVSIIALSGLIALQILTLSNFNISVTLPGIGGIILSIGMSIDGNVVIFERIKEELNVGKSLRASIDSGFKRAFVAILDSNITTIIIAVVLYLLGSGPVKGFGITLFFGTLYSFIFSVTASKTMLRGFSNFKFAKNKLLFGMNKKQNGGKSIETI